MAKSTKIELAGKRFGRWTVLRFSRVLDEAARWICACDCGTEREVSGALLRRGKSKSCGCLMKERAAVRMRKHGHHGSPEYNAWQAMIQRCTNCGHPEYKRYGDRGIAVCRRWSESVEAFCEDMGPRPSPKHSLDRIDNSGDYEPSNCRWATQVQQNRNTRRTRFLEFQGQTKSVGDWSDETGIATQVLLWRIRKGWTADRALTTPTTV